VPSPAAGVVKELRVKIGDKVSQGSPVLVLESTATKPAEQARAPATPAREAAAPPPSSAARESAPSSQPTARGSEALTGQKAPTQRVAEERAQPSHALPRGEIDEASFGKVHASPAVRRLAREFGVDLTKVQGGGPKGRILREDVQGYVKSELTQPRAPAASGGGGLGFDLPPLQPVDFSKFGAVESKPLSRIKKLSGAFLHRNWLSIPHVTQHDEADVTELEAFRKSQAEEAKAQGIRFTILGFLMKASVVALRQFPEFNASLAPDGESLVLKKYFHIGVAVDTPNGLVVPVIRDVDKKGLLELARELGEVSVRMRDGKIAPTDLQGGCFSISSLGGIGGTMFTPIINAPEVAILGVGKAVMKPVWSGKEFAPRLMLPLSLSYDHRVIDGASGARFISFLSSVLGDIRKLVL
jgi:pyruvate dehydrogenase E2 component (dihydrolipoamide acetyltransferase)